MKPDPALEARRWLRQAEEDLGDAEYLLAGTRFSTACFLAQQAAEKAVKAYLYRQGAEVVWGHSVSELCRDAASFHKGFEAWITRGALLDRYYLPTRYPDSLPGGIPKDAFDEADAKKACELAASLIQMVEGLLGE